MSGEKHPITVTILDKDYKILCKHDEIDSLKMAAMYLNRKMREIKNSGKVVGAERIAIMTALNISHELLASTSKTEQYTQSMRERLISLKEKISQSIECS